ncbi:Asp23/Gls24 family envelope stress response protein [Kribbella sp. HUAS MG21]|uniref:Asp23/Gls24 family envelope stress response protein n=1 Tax=Kribbella sp. HUAS MG21 TaxID=3160966 RepID=A0AAU7T9Z8_9ACTN
MSDVEVERIALAETAAVAARSVAGVVRLQPGLVGLLKQLAAQAWERATGRPVPDVAGIDVALDADGGVQIDARIVTAVDHQAAEVGSAVHSAITAAVEAATGRVPRVRIRIVEIDLEPQHNPR